MEISRSYYLKLKKFHDCHSVLEMFLFRVNEEGERVPLPAIQITCGSSSFTTTREMFIAFVDADVTLQHHPILASKIREVLVVRGPHDAPVQENLVESPSREYAIYLRADKSVGWFARYWYILVGLGMFLMAVYQRSILSIQDYGEPMPFHFAWSPQLMIQVEDQYPRFIHDITVHVGHFTVDLHVEITIIWCTIVFLLFLLDRFISTSYALVHSALVRIGYLNQPFRPLRNWFGVYRCQGIYKDFCLRHGYTMYCTVMLEERIFEKLRSEFAMWQVTDPGSGTIQRGVINHPWTQHLPMDVRERVAWLIIQEAQIDRYSRLKYFGKIEGRDDAVSWSF